MSSDGAIFDPSDSPNTESSSRVISLDEVRLSRGWSKGPRCEHRNLVYSDADRRVECKSCSQPVDGFDAFMVLVRHFDRMQRKAESNQKRADDALKAVVVRRAAKMLDKCWGSKLAPGCPHCGGGLLPDDFADGYGSARSVELELARRARAKALQDGRDG